MSRALQPHRIALLAALAPVVAVHLAWWLNVPALEPSCNPYLSGCMSVSGAARSGEGLHLFRALVLPSAGLLALSWLLLPYWLRELLPHGSRLAGSVGWTGFAGALFLILYATWLGTEGDFYRWLRHQGVVWFFGLTGLAQLLLAAVLWPRRSALARPVATLARVLLTIVALQWLIGLASAFKNLYLPDDDLADALGNLLEWAFLWTLTGAQATVALLFRASGFVLRPGLER